jgi:hypothetical protein
MAYGAPTPTANRQPPTANAAQLTRHRVVRRVGQRGFFLRAIYFAKDCAGNDLHFGVRVGAFNAFSASKLQLEARRCVQSKPGHAFLHVS